MMQPDKFACAVTCTQAVLRHVGIDRDFCEIDAINRQPEKYSRLGRPATYLDRVFATEARQLRASLEDSPMYEGIGRLMQALWETRLPVIAGHAVNIGLPRYLTRNPLLPRHALSIDENSEYAHAGIVTGVYSDASGWLVVGLMDPWAGLALLSPRSKGLTYYRIDEFLLRWHLEQLSERTKYELREHIAPGQMIALRRLPDAARAPKESS